MGDEHSTPLLRGNSIIVPAVNEYVELLSVESDALSNLLVGHIKIEVNDATAKPMLKVTLDGKPYLTDYQMLSTSITFDWGRHLRLHGKGRKPITVQIKQTQAGAGKLYASAFVDGLEVPI